MSSITISADALPTGYYNAPGSTAELRIAIKSGFRNSAGVYIPAGDIQDRNSCLVLKTCTVNGDKSVSIPMVTELFTTLDSIDAPNVKFIAALFSEDGSYSIPWPSQKLAGGFRIQPNLAPVATWVQIITTQGHALVNPPPYYITLADLLVLGDGRWGSGRHASSVIEGWGYADVDPTNPTRPTFVGINSPLLPITGQRQALVGTSGTPSSSNRYITDADSRVPTQNENDALVGTSGSPSSSNKYVTASSFGVTINVRDYATAGAGTSVSPWTGWDTAITWSPYTTYTFSDGYFGYSTSPQWGRCGIALLCGKNTYLKFTGSGVGFDFTARDTPAGFSLAITQAARIGPFRLVGNSGMTVGFDISGVQQCIFEDFRVKSVSQTAIKIRFSISCIYLMPRFSVNEEGTGHGTPVPVNGILLDNRSGGAEPCQDNTFIGAVAEGTTGYGIQLQGNCWLNTFIGGTSEANGGGISVGQLCKQNSFKGFDLEANTAYDVLNNGENSVFENLLCASSTGVVFDSFSKNSVWRDGQFQTATVNANAQDTLFDGVMGINVITSGGGIIDNGTNTAIQGFLHDLQSVGAGTYYGGGFNAWRTPTLLNSWANVGGTNAVAQYVKDAIGWVSIRGCISGGSTGVVVFTLPVGFRPAKDERFAVVTDTGYGSLSVSSSGDIVLVSGGTTSFVFMEARFRTV